jgi:hypothetical protein
MKKKFSIIFFILISFFLLFSSAVNSRGNCWGIFQNKTECEAQYRYERDLKVCRENSWDLCEKYSKLKGSQYCSCLDRARNSCMIKLGWDSSIGASACDNGE